MKKKTNLFKLKKNCPFCKRMTQQLIESLYTLCMKCKQKIYDDADELFGIEENLGC